MTLDSHSLERLRQLGRKLPEKINNPNKKNEEKAKIKPMKKAHPVETENNPERLFHELINISEDGTVPIHLIDRLREAEAKSKRNDHIIKNEFINKSEEVDSSLSKTKNNNLDNEANELYITFKQLLLEDDV